ncbi:MAG: hypothetical protein JJ850_10925 [Kordiimonadaceae bacterium]|nr:hypothetical protein [Kordiimonadaceae bacterium]MBO6568902.1 hypothetical protein [Kordiimonadaceae bacterium]MBO6965123.1 hypothetical protein [Kordiimonadaceae bacterium]
MKIGLAASTLLLASISVGVAAQQSEPLVQAAQNCIGFAGNKHDPNYSGPGPDERPQISFVEAIRSCEFALRNTEQPSAQLRYSAAQMFYWVGNYQTADALADRLVNENYPAAIDIILSIRMRQNGWADNNQATIQELAATAKAGGYNRIDFDLGLAYEGLARRVSSRPGFEQYAEQQRTHWVTQAIDHYAKAVASGHADARFKLAKLQIALNAGAGGAWNSMRALAAEGDKAAEMFVKIEAHVAKRKPYRQTRSEARTAFRDAVEANIYEATVMALLKADDFQEENIGVDAGSFHEKRLYQLHLQKIQGELEVNEYLQHWVDEMGGLNLDNLNIDRNRVLQAGFLSGFPPAGYALIKSQTDDPSENAKWPILEIASHRADYGYTYNWIRTTLMAEFEGGEPIDRNQLSLPVSILRRLISQRDHMAALNAAELMKRAGVESETGPWLNHFLEAIQQKVEGQSDRVNASVKRYYLQEMLKTLNTHNFQFPEQLYRRASQLHGENFAYAVNDYLRDEARLETDLEQLRALQFQGYRIAALSTDVKAVLSENALPKLAEDIERAVLKTKPYCLQVKRWSGGLAVAWDEKSFTVSKAFSSTQIGYRYGVGYGPDGTSKVFSLYLNEGKEDVRPSNVSASERGWLQNARPVFLPHAFGGIFSGPSDHRWDVIASAEPAYARAVRAGSDTINYTLNFTHTFGPTTRTESKSGLIVFDGFSNAVRTGEDGYRGAKRLFDAKECQPQ